MKLTYKNNEKGNVLFLILIAVALFAALSYAVTQSSRSGGDAGRETNVLNSAQLTQYPNQVRTAIVRMVIDGRSITSLEFNDPGSFNTAADSVFHPQGGGAVFQKAPSDMMADGTEGTWVYNMEFEVPEIGTSDGATSFGGNDVIAFLPGVTQEVCQRLNLEAAITSTLAATVPLTADISGVAAGDYDFNMIDTYPAASARGVTLDSAAGNLLTGHPFGCFQNGGTSPDNEYVYYHVLYER